MKNGRNGDGWAGRADSHKVRQYGRGGQLCDILAALINLSAHLSALCLQNLLRVRDEVEFFKSRVQDGSLFLCLSVDRRH